jgi:Formate--tetrahydrofolate ligase
LTNSRGTVANISSLSASFRNPDKLAPFFTTFCDLHHCPDCPSIVNNKGMKEESAVLGINGMQSEISRSGPYDATRLQNWQISELAEEHMPTPIEWTERLGLEPNEVIPMGRLCKLDFLRIMDRLKNHPDGKYIEVTAITPTPLGEGKSTTALGLIEGLGKRGQNVGGCFRQPSGGPTMNIKGTVAGGGNALLIPMTEFSMGLTGDINDLMNAHNLAMVALTARMEHERN